MNEQAFRQLFPNASKSLVKANCKVSHPEPEPDQAPALDEATTGENEVLDRVTIRFTGYRIRPLDPDNFIGGLKDLIDGLRHASLIHGDEYWRIKLEAEQERVAKKSEERTEVEIMYP